MFYYFASYVVKTDEELNFGNYELSLNSKPNTIREIEDMARRIEKSMGFPEYSVVILNYQLLREVNL